MKRVLLLLLLGTGGLLATWAVFGAGFIGSRAVVLLLRAHGERWMVAGTSSSGTP